MTNKIDLSALLLSGTRKRKGTLCKRRSLRTIAGTFPLRLQHHLSSSRSLLPWSTDPSVSASFPVEPTHLLMPTGTEALQSLRSQWRPCPTSLFLTYATSALPPIALRFWILETVARMPYFAILSVLHLYETFGWWHASELRKVHFAEDWNELHHLLIMESLGK